MCVCVTKKEKERERERERCLVAYHHSNILLYLRDRHTQPIICTASEIEIADQTCHLTQSQCTDIEAVGHGTDSVMPDAWHGTRFEVTGMT